MSESKKVPFLHMLSFYTLVATVFLLPLFFIPSLAVPLDVSKGLLLSIGVTLSFVFWILARLVDGRFVIPKDPLMLAAVVLPLVFLAASLFSGNMPVSLGGYAFETGTFTSILVFSAAFFLAAVHFQDKRRIPFFFLSILASFALVALFELVVLFIPFGGGSSFFAQLTSANLIGSWNDFGAFSGLVCLLALLALELLPLARGLRIFLWVSVVASLFFLAIVNFFSLFMIIGILALIVFVYALSVPHAGKAAKEDGERRFPLASFLVVLICLSFIVANNFFGQILPQAIGVANVEIRPSVEGTLNIAGQTLRTDPVFGAGPNRFAERWFMHKPETVNTTAFWNSNFNAGFNMILTFLVTTGIVGALAWAAFLLYFFYRGVASSVFSSQDRLSTFFSFGSFATALYLWILAIAYVPNVVSFSLAFIATGVFVGVLVHRKDIKEYDFSFLSDPRSSFFSILLLVLLMVGALAGGYGFVNRFASISAFEQSMRALRTESPDLGLAEARLFKAVQLKENDLYYRALSEIYLAQLNLLLRDESLSEETVKTELQASLSKAEESARLAIAYDTKNYLNWIMLGTVYESVVPLKVEGAYENSKTAYEEAFKYNRENPGISLSLARLEVANGNTDAAKARIAEAIAKKPNYTEAYYLASGIALSAGDQAGAMAELEKAVAAAPSDAGARFQLGVLRFNARDYEGAAGSFERAVLLAPSNLDAHYLLALAYERTGRKDQAKAHLEFLQARLPDNQTVADALEKLAAGQPLVSNASSASLDEGEEESEE